MTSSQTQQTTPENDILRDGKRVLAAINRHLLEERCNHSLREIVKEGLE